MKHLQLLLLCLSHTFILTSQHQDWLPEGAKLYYANYPWGLPGPPTIESITVVGANETDSSQIRILTGNCGGCENLTVFGTYLERVGDKVFFCKLQNSSRYLLYDFGAGMGDTLRLFAALHGGNPYYTELVIENIDTISFFDTLQERSHYALIESGYEYGSYIYDELGGNGCLFPQYGACDPQSGPLVAYYHPEKGFHCFDTTVCVPLITEANYAPFPDLTARFYEHREGKVYAVEIEDVMLSGDTVRYFPNKSATDSIDYLLDDNSCFSASGGWMFHHADYLTNGKTIFYTGDNFLKLANPISDEVWIDTRAEIGGSWLAMSSFSFNSELEPFELYAEVTEKSAMNVLGIMDTVKHIRFTSPETDAFDDLYLLLGKETGLVSSVNFRQLSKFDREDFINVYDMQGTLPLVGGNASPIGMHNLTWRAVWNFEVGDQLHTRTFEKPFYNDPAYTQTDRIWEILDKDWVPGSGGYEYVIDQQSRITRLDSIYDITLTRDTITSQFFPMERFDRLPGTLVSVNSPEPYFHQSTWLDRTTKAHPNWIEFHDYFDCLHVPIIDGCLSDITYIEGLGGPYYACQNFFTGGEYERSIRYFKKESEEWGTPFDFTVSLKESKKPSDISVEIYPNPADDVIHVSNIGQHGSITIYDLHGLRQLVSEISDGYNKIDVSHIQSGMYLIKLNLETISYVSRVFIE